MQCRLCGKKTKLEQSHIIPKFIYRYIKQTSLTGGIRSGETPNMRQEDGLIIPFLCNSCEDLFCKYETYFSSKIFFPMLNNKITEVSVCEDLVGFAVSLLWRCLKHRLEAKFKIEELTEKELESLRVFTNCCENYFKTNDISNLSKYSIHIIPLTENMENSGKIPMLSSINQRGTDTSFRAFCKEQEGFDYLIFYVKIPFFLFVVEVIPNSKYVWSCSDILHENIVLNQETVEINELVTEIIRTTYENKIIAGKKISDKQMNLIVDKYNKAIQKGLNERQEATINAKKRENEYLKDF